MQRHTRLSKHRPDIQKSYESKGRILLAHYIEQIGHNDKAAKLRVEIIISELWEEVVLKEKHAIRIEAICATVQRSCNTAPGTDGIRLNYRTTTWNTLPKSSTLASRSKRIGYTATCYRCLSQTRTILKSAPIESSRCRTLLANYWGKLFRQWLGRALHVPIHIERCVNAAVFAQEVFQGFQVREETCAATVDTADAYNGV